MANSRTNAEFSRVKSDSPIAAKITRDIPPSTAPIASRSALRVPSLSSTNVNDAGRIAGKARKTPPNRGPTALDTIPAATETAAPSANRVAISFRLACLAPPSSSCGRTSLRTDEHRPVEAEAHETPTNGRYDRAPQGAQAWDGSDGDHTASRHADTANDHSNRRLPRLVSSVGYRGDGQAGDRDRRCRGEEP